MELFLLFLLVVVLGVGIFLWRRGALTVNKEKLHDVAENVKDQIKKRP